MDLNDVAEKGVAIYLPRSPQTQTCAYRVNGLGFLSL